MVPFNISGERKNRPVPIVQVSDDRLFNTRNDWILLRRDAATNGTNAASVARKLFDTYLGDAYVLPDSAVYLLQRADDGAWEIWTGFRASVSDAIRVYRVGSASPDVNGLDEGRRRFRGITLKANTVVSPVTCPRTARVKTVCADCGQRAIRRVRRENKFRSGHILSHALRHGRHVVATIGL